MKTSINKRTHKTTTITWNGMLTTDDGIRVASMTATLDMVRPRGTTNMIVMNQDLYNQYEDEVTEAYDLFMEQVRQAADSTVLVTDETDGDPTIDDSPTPPPASPTGAFWTAWR